jgi:predicted Zn-dependent peptidase
MFKKSILKNGLRVITVEKPESHSLASGIFVKAGSRNEDPKINGISHFLEHLLFKGTKKFPSQLAVSEAIEGVGGELNAWTDQDHTHYYNKVPTKELTRSLEVLSEMIQYPLLRQEDIEREKGVIVEEINRKQDNPAAHVWELISATLWPNQPLGLPVLGSKAIVMTFTAQDFADYLERWYEPRNMVLAVAGKISHETVVAEADKQFGSLENKEAGLIIGAQELQEEPRTTLHHKKTDQAHLIVGFHALSYSDPDRYMLGVMNAILGQGMSSRLFLRIREEKGLAYHISSYDENFQDTGGLFIHAGLNLGKLEHALEAIVLELQKLKKKPVGQSELKRVKQYIRGGLEMSVDDTETMAVWFGKGELFEPKLKTPEEVIALVERVTADDVKRVAQRIFVPQKASLALIAPVKENKRLTKYLEELS